MKYTVTFFAGSIFIISLGHWQGNTKTALC
jgi:hypothetical protein